MKDGLHNPASKDSIKLCLSLNIYSLEAIKKVCYKFADRCSILLNEASDREVEIIFEFPEKTDEPQRKEILRAFSNELLDQDLREQIAKETEATRNLILAEAFSKTSLIGD